MKEKLRKLHGKLENVRILNHHFICWNRRSYKYEIWTVVLFCDVDTHWEKIFQNSTPILPALQWLKGVKMKKTPSLLYYIVYEYTL